MILQYVNAVSGEELDRVTITSEGVKYRTGKAEPMVGIFVRRYGLNAAADVLAEWTNGYVSTSEIDG